MNTPRRRPPVEWRLRNASGDQLPFHLRPGDSLSIGRDLSADIPVLHAGVSRHHAIFELDAGELWLEDLHSQGGTTVNGERVRRARVDSGDVLTFGGLSFTLTKGDEERDPCRRLSRERLLGLLRLSRDIGSGAERGLVFGRVVQAAVDELRARRGIILLRDPERPAFLPAAAHPASLLASASRILPPGAAERISTGPGARAISPSALGAPLGGCAGKPHGIIYIERGAGMTFDPEEIDMLSAIAWTASPAVETAARFEAMRAWNSRLEAALAPGARKVERHAGEHVERDETGASLARLAEDHLALESLRLEGVADGAASAALENAAALLAAARRLLERRSARVEEIRIGQALAEVFDAGRGAHPAGPTISVVHGKDIPVLCAPDELVDALRLARSLLAAPRVRKGARYGAWASATPDGQWIDLTLSASPAGTTGGAAGWPERLRVLRRLVMERLGGSVEAGPEGEALRIRLPNLAPEMRESRLLGELARRGTRTT